MTKEDFKRAISAALEKINLKGRGWTWYSSSYQNFVAVDFQKSNYSNKYYINICCAPEGVYVDGAPTPKEHKFPIRIRAGGVFLSREEDIESMFDLEDNSLSDAQRYERISEFLIEEVGPFLRRIGDVAGLKSAITEGAFKRGLINRAAQESLGL